MGVNRKLLLTFLLLAALFVPARAFAAPAEKDQVVFGGSFTLEADETLDGNLLVIGGSVVIEEGARVDGNVTQLGGSVRIDGRVEGDVSQVGGSLNLESNAQIDGDVQTSGGSFDRAEGARVDGVVRSNFSDVVVESSPPRQNRFGQFVLDSFWNLFRVFSSSALAVVITLLWPQRLAVTAKAITTNPVMAGGVGLLVVGVAIPVLVIAAITILLIPFSLLGFVVLAAGIALGWSALSLEVGKRIAEGTNQEWTPPLAAGVGAILLGVIFVGVDQIPCIGWAMQVMVSLIALGAVTITRAGELTEVPRG